VFVGAGLDAAAAAAAAAAALFSNRSCWSWIAQVFVGAARCGLDAAAVAAIFAHRPNLPAQTY
jgi:hypothetical protein